MSTKSDLHNQLQDVITKLRARAVDEKSTSKITNLLTTAQNECIISDDYAMDIDLKLTYIKNMIGTKSGDWVNYNEGKYPINELFGKLDAISKELMANNFVSHYHLT